MVARQEPRPPRRLGSHDPSDAAHERNRLQASRRHWMIRRLPANFEQLNRPSFLRGELGKQIFEHLPSNESRAATSDQYAVGFEQLDCLCLQPAIAAKGI